MSLCLRAAVAMACLAPLWVHADEIGIRTGIGLGLASIDFERGFAEGDIAWSVYAAYDFNRYLGVEAAYVDGGSPHESFVTVEQSYAAVIGSASLPIGRVWSISVRAGAANWYWESGGVNRDGVDPLYGVGAALEFTRLHVRLIADTAEIDDARILHFGLQGAWKF